MVAEDDVTHWDEDDNPESLIGEDAPDELEAGNGELV
jgi:hypothetical protein